jgi:hypothetical protein
MEIPNLPIWSAYLIAPALLLLFAGKVIVSSPAPLVIAAFAVGSGLVCAAVLHGYVLIKRKLKG